MLPSSPTKTEFKISTSENDLVPGNLTFREFSHWEFDKERVNGDIMRFKHFGRVLSISSTKMNHYQMCIN